jgi:hypothetical protein
VASATRKEADGTCIATIEAMMREGSSRQEKE